MNENILDLFNFLAEYDPGKGGQLLTEQLVPANIRTLIIAMNNDKELSDFLNTPAKDLPENYRYVVDEITEEDEDRTLYDLICGSISLRKSIKSYFSENNGKLTGFTAYGVNKNEVIEIKMFSFNPSSGSGSGLLRDLRNLLNDLIVKYENVSWSALKINPANKIYQKAIQMYDGNVEEDGALFRYSIPGKKLKKYEKII
jgi:hypothetical protein